MNYFKPSHGHLTSEPESEAGNNKLVSPVERRSPARPEPPVSSSQTMLSRIIVSDDLLKGSTVLFSLHSNLFSLEELRV